MVNLKLPGRYQDIRSQWKRLSEVPFDSEARFMVVNCENKHEGKRSFMKGAPAEVIKHCQIVPDPTDADRNWTQIIESMASRGYKVLGFASGNYPLIMRFDGVLAMKDPPRPGVRESIEECQHAGIRIVMATGDSPAYCW